MKVIFQGASNTPAVHDPLTILMPDTTVSMEEFNAKMRANPNLASTKLGHTNYSGWQRGTLF
jgi:hypothetical protein